MKLTTLLVTSLAAFGLASPVAIADADSITPRDTGNDLLTKRDPQICRIVNASTVNCRKGPGTNYGVVTTVKKGQLFLFMCLVSGECVTVGGATNWYVARSPELRQHKRGFVQDVLG